ncbi:protein WVD2-like 7 isoform X1 [Olea europaea var. sylvestris]|uniref:protein WVD2-like 7 isoform X1 n=1 Tax=Olea europaea var. sylvestris TaxID=158386 RepID=UPI000C1D521F|nr:protein WVD2-like 7 isoform X1 [Olea europaea var. sylvestris]
MGESSACLMRSLSQPSPTSSDEKQRDPLQRALSSSISFGRFMSESLDWEKWSAFTHNRYLEEVEKYKRPGSVAEKKAYFEARYKRRKAEALLEQDNEACTDLPQLNETNENQDNSSSDSESAQKNGNVVTGITKKDDVQNSEVTVLEGISEDAESSVKKSSNKLEIERDIGNIMPNKADNTQEKGATMGDSALSGKKKPAFSPAKLSTTKNSDLSTPNCKKTVRNSTNKMRSTPRSLHRSINFDAHPREAIKASSPGPKKIVNSRLIPTLSNKSKDSNVAPTSTRASMNSMVKLPAVTPRPENKSYSRPSSTRESKAQTSTVPSSFIFKSEERAAKRKEFFQKLEEKKNAKEPEKQLLQAKSSVSLSIEKPKIDFRDMRHSIAFKVGPNGKTSAKTESPNNLVKKIPKIQTCEEEFKEKAASKVQDKDSRPAWRFSAKTDGSKDVAGKSSRPPIYSAKSLPKKRQHENVSPNIQP